MRALASAKGRTLIAGISDIFSLVKGHSPEVAEKSTIGSRRALAGRDRRATSRRALGQGTAPVVDGKFLRVDGERFYVRGVTYGTFAETEGYGLFPGRERIEKDFAAMAAAGINTVRTYTAPEPETLDLAEQAGLKLLMGVWWDDPRYLDPVDRWSWKKMAAEAREAVERAVGSYAHHPAVLGFVLGNEIPGPVIHYYGRRRVEDLLRGLYETGKGASPDALFSYANYPTTQYLDTSYFDFDCFNVFLEDESAYRRYLAQLQVSTGDRPLILTELGLDSGGGEDRQAESLDWQLRVAAELGLAGTCVFSWTDDWWVGGNKVEGWYFGLTREDRAPKPSLNVLEDHYRKKPLDLRERWPKASVIVCAYQAEETIDECLQSLMELNYPDYEVLVVDDGSTDATAEIASEYPVRLLREGRFGLSSARNLGLERAEGEIIAYIDADAQADPDWLIYLALALESHKTAGAGGPNPTPYDDPFSSQCVARAPGGPIHVLLDNERAEHVPGCNMAFWREPLLEIGGFDPVYRTAGDDVDVCWKLTDKGYGLRFHPSALVWHRRRVGLRAFWRQQRGYGEAEALVERNHPERFNDLGQATWSGVIYDPPCFMLWGQPRLYSGRFGSAPFQSLYGLRTCFNPISALTLILALCLLGLLNVYLLSLPALSLVALGAIYVRHGAKIARREKLHPTWSAGALIGLLHLLQPLARTRGRMRGGIRGQLPARDLPSPNGAGTSWPLQSAGHGMFLTEGVEEVGRESFLNGLRKRFRVAGLRPKPLSGWEEADITSDSTLFWRAQIVSYESWGKLYLRLVYRLRFARVAIASTLAIAFVLLWSTIAAAGAIIGLLAALLIERAFFARKIHRSLAEDSGGYGES
jgi:O-antigen biosynthesis protein